MSTKVLGVMRPHWTSQVLNTGYEAFESPCGISGLARLLNPLKLEILAVEADEPGTGQFRAFIAAAQQHFDCICVWHISDAWLADALGRYGFLPTVQIEPNDGEVVEGMKWERVKP